jgi:uncharacterized SAM-binding protein YcdF (DUF218 family)
MTTPSLTTEQVEAITSYVDIDAPPFGEPTAHLIFGTNQTIPASLVAERYHDGTAPFIIATGGANRHNGIIEGREFFRLLTESGVPGGTIRYEDRSTNTWQNVEFALPFLHEALALGLSITIVSKWYHRRTVHILRTFLPEAEYFHAISWAPVYAGKPVTRNNWTESPDGYRRVVREWQEVTRRVRDGSFQSATLREGAWH